MDPAPAIALTVAAGGLVALQAPINSHLGKAVGTFQSVLINFIIGTVIVLVVAAVTGGGLGQVRHAAGLSWYWFMGGVIGVVYVASVLVTVRALGVGGVTAATIAGQLAIAVAADHFGWLGVERSPVTAGKMAGVALLAVGVWLVVRD